MAKRTFPKNISHGKPLAEYLEERLSPPDANGCRNWLLSGNKNGYGGINRGKGKPRLTAHRVAWEMAHGPIPAGMNVCHRCDNPRCANVEHLFLGTTADNVADKVAKGRMRVGERHPRAKLTESDVLKMRKLYATGDYSFPKLAKMYGVCMATAHNVVRRTFWRHVEAK